GVAVRVAGARGEPVRPPEHGFAARDEVALEQLPLPRVARGGEAVPRVADVLADRDRGVLEDRIVAEARSRGAVGLELDGGASVKRATLDRDAALARDLQFERGGARPADPAVRRALRQATQVPHRAAPDSDCPP